MRTKKLDATDSTPQLVKQASSGFSIAPPDPAETRRGANHRPRSAGGSPRPILPPHATRITAVAGKAASATLPPSPRHQPPAPDRLNAVAGAVAGGGGSPLAVLDTTAQLLHADPKDAKETLRKRARSKARTEAVVEGLSRLGTETPLRFGYAATLCCSNVLRQDGATVKGKYCGNRWCTVCNRIRTAKLRTAYAPELATWKDAQFVTLTLPNVPANRLHSTVREILNAVRRIANNVRRTDGLSWRAVRKLEVTYNRQRRDYHPHLHLLVQGNATAHQLVARWLATFPTANAGAQKVVPCVGANAMAELFKYLTKQAVKDENGDLTAPPARALDTIYKSVRKLRTIQAMGFKVSRLADVVQDEDATLTLDASTPAPAARTEPVEWEWSPALTDWIDFTTGEVLADYDPTPEERATLRRMRGSAFPLDDPPPMPFGLWIRR